MLVKSHSSSITWCFSTDSYLSHVDEHGHAMVAKEEMHGKLIFLHGRLWNCTYLIISYKDRSILS